MKSLLEGATRELQSILPALPDFGGKLQRLGEAMLATWAKRGKVLTAGNGGSACDAMHLADELSVRFMKNRKALAAVALCADPTALTCAANDYGFDEVFARQINALGRSGDVALAISTSGTSPSIVRALRECRRRRIVTIGLTGGRGGRLAKDADIVLRVSATTTTARIQETHILVGHVLCDQVDARLFGAKRNRR